MLRDIQDETRGRWPGIFSALGIDVGFSGKHTACPICGPGSNGDRFRMDDKDGEGTWICNLCGAGKGVELVKKVMGVDFKEAVKVIRTVLGVADISKPQKEATISKETLRKIYIESKEITKRDLVSKYLKNRGLSITSEILRYSPKCYEPESHMKIPAMLAVFSAPDSKAITMHRTYLTSSGEKAKIKSPKKVLPALQPLRGGAIRLFQPINGVIAVAEGIETALAVSELKEIPCWSTLSSSLMQGFEPPKGIKHLMIFGDNDKNFAGQKAAYTLANRQAEKVNVQVYIPPKSGDWLDVLNERRQNALVGRR